MAVFEIPLSPQPQVFSIQLAQVTYRLKVYWNDAVDGGWTLDLMDANGDPIIDGIPLVTDEDLLTQYAYLGIGGGLFVQTDGDLSAVPTFQNLGVNSHLYFVTADA